MSNIHNNKELGNSLNKFSEFKDFDLEKQFQEYFWEQRKQYFFISYFICTTLFLIHGLFDFKRLFVHSSPLFLMGIRFTFFLLCIHFVYYYRKITYPKFLYEYCFILKLFSVLVILLLTIFTGGLSKTLLIGSMIMCASFYVMLPGRAVYSLLSSLCITSVYLFLGDFNDSNYAISCFILLSSNFILWFFCKNQHKYNRLEFLHQNNLRDLGEMKTKMLTTLAHDIRSPLSVILMRAEIGERRSENEKMKEHFSRIKSNTNRIEGLIKELLNWTFTKNSSTFHVEESKNSIAKTINSSIEYVSDDADIKNIKLISNLDDILIPHDPTMVETIFRNLLSNSIKFSEENSTVRIESFHKNAYHVKIFDTGATLTKDQIQKIQSGDNQESNVGTNGEKGYGLGLSLVKTFLNMHNASIYITENPDGGNIFELVFPL